MKAVDTFTRQPWTFGSMVSPFVNCGSLPKRLIAVEWGLVVTLVLGLCMLILGLQASPAIGGLITVVIETTSENRGREDPTPNAKDPTLTPNANAKDSDDVFLARSGLA